MGETISLTTKDGAKISAYKAMPQGKPKAGLVVLQEIFGVNRHMRNVADDFAAQGYLAIAPALFDRVKPGIELGYEPTDLKEGMDIRSKTKLDESLADIEAAIAVAAEAGPVGIVGYCWGGTLSYAAATRFDTLCGAVAYYGGGIAASLGESLLVPTEMHFGDLDKSIPPADIEKIKSAHPDTPIFVYEGAEHGFSCDDRASFNKQSADLARERTLAFFGRYLLA